MDRGIIQTTIETCRAIVQYAQLKCVGAVGVLTYSFFFGDIEQQIISAVICLAIFDMITGILAEVKSGKSIESKKLFKTAIKLFVYMLMISSGHLTESAIGYELKIDEIITAIIAVTEIISILENASRMGYAIPKKLLNQLKDFKSQK
jgi:toxin secretion/phage lysis holin